MGVNSNLVLEFCDRRNIKEYYKLLVEYGYDDLNVIVETLTKEEIDDVFKSAIPKAGHRAKLWLAVRKEKEEGSKVNISTQKICATSEKSEESSSVRSSAAWQKESLGWVPFARKPISIFYNEVLKEMHGCIWDDLPYEDTFRKVFNSEKVRQHSYEKQLVSIETKLNFITSNNMAAAGTLLDNEPAPYSGSNIKRNIGSLVELKSRVDAIKNEVIEHDASIMLGNGGPRLPYLKFHHRSNNVTLARLNELLEKIEAVTKQLQKCGDRVVEVFGEKMSASKINSKRSLKENRRKAIKRKDARFKTKIVDVYNKVTTETAVDPIFESNLPASIINFDGVRKLTPSDSDKLLVLIEGNVFDHGAKCCILDLLPHEAETAYWNAYDIMYNSSSEDSSSDCNDS